MNCPLYELDGYEFVVGEDSTADVIVQLDEGRVELEQVMFKGEDVLPRLSVDEKKRIQAEVQEACNAAWIEQQEVA